MLAALGHALQGMRMEYSAAAGRRSDICKHAERVALRGALAALVVALFALGTYTEHALWQRSGGSCRPRMQVP